MSLPREAPGSIDQLGAAEMSDVIVLDEQGTEHELTSLWSSRRVLLVFLRHFGCRFCKQQVDMLNMVAPTLKEHDCEVVLVSLGTSEQITKFRAEMEWSGE